MNIRLFHGRAFSARVPQLLLLALAAGLTSGYSADYIFIGLTSNWSDGTKWALSSSPSTPAGSFPDDASDNVVGNSSASRVELTTDISIGNFTSTLSGWTVNSVSTNASPVTLSIGGTLSNAQTMTFRSNTSLMSMNVNRLVASGSTLALGITINGVTERRLNSLSINDLDLSGGIVTMAVIGTQNLGLVHTNSASSILRLNTEGTVAMSKTVNSSGIDGANATIIAASSVSLAHSTTLAISNTTTYSTGAVFVNNNGGAGSTLSITKSGTGTQKFTGSSTYSGGTTITAGTLLVNNVAGSGLGTGGVVVASGGVLGGTGSISGTTTVSGAISPGDGGIESLDITNDVTWNGGNNWLFELGSGNTSDRLNITGAGSDFLKGTGSAWGFNFQNTGALGTFTLVDWAGTSTFLASDFSYTGLASGYTGVFSFNGTQLDFTVTSVPEPGTWALISLGFVALLGLTRGKVRAVAR